MVAAETSVTNTEDEAIVPEREQDTATFAPQVDVVEEEDSVNIVADMPGVSKEDVDIVLEEGVLTIEGRAQVYGEEEMELRRQEYQVGDFYRRFSVGEGLDVSEDADITATMENGVLHLSLPKAQRFQKRQIEIQ